LKILLDTNALIWLIEQTDKKSLGNGALKLINEAEVVYVSSVSILEIRIKTMLGKLVSEKDLVNDTKLAGLKNLSFEMSHADAILSFPDLQRHDLFDRMLLAQAQVEGLTFLTSDNTLLGLNISFIVNARK
jgi:PIN domain nuclease of toxin-antitoxin system